MQFITQSENIEDYLVETDIINFSDREIQTLISQLFQVGQTEIEKVQVAFQFVRDEIAHSWDIQEEQVTCSASEVFKYKHGICYAKSNLLSALLRSQYIPTGFCYQRLMLFDSPEKGYCIHALNAVHLKSVNKWIRLDARGNKPGVDAQFSIEEEKLAFTVNEELGEFDYPTIYVEPNENTVKVLMQSTNAIDMYFRHLPQSL